MSNYKQEGLALVPELEAILKRYHQKLSPKAQPDFLFEDDATLFELKSKNLERNEDLEFESILKKEGLKTTTFVDKKTPVIIQSLLEQKNVLSPFIATKISQISIPKSYVYYPWDETFTSAYVRITKTVVPFGSREEKKLLNIRGFYHPQTGTIHVRPRTNFGMSLLLAIQKLSHPGFRGFFGGEVHKGVSYYFANAVLREQGLEPLQIENMQDPLNCAEDLSAVVGFSLVGKAYFQSPVDLIKHLSTKLVIGPLDARELNGDALLRSNLLHTARFAGNQAKDMTGVGITTAKSVRLWMRSATAGPHEVQITGGSGNTKNIKIEVQGQPGDNTSAVNYPNSPSDPALDPLTKYKYRIVRIGDRSLIGEGAFETSPASDKDTPEKVVIALMSCHQPFTDRGTFDPRSIKMLKILPRVLKDNNVKFIIPCGDQIYADEPGIFSLFNNPYLVSQVVPGKTDIMKCNEDQVRSLYDMRYRTCWSMKAIKDMYANYPCYPIMDDHDIKNSWGTRREHSCPGFSNIYKGALNAYYDYQASRVLPRMPGLPGSFHYHFSYGNIGIFVMDLRSGRFSLSQRETRIFGTKQLDDLRKFLADNAHKKVLFIVTSVPVFFVPEWMARYGPNFKADTFEDHWSHPNNIPDRDAFLKVLHAHRQANPNQVVAILSGDVHIGNACSIDMQGLKSPGLYQFTSSPITVNESSSTKLKVKIAPVLDTTINAGFDFPCGPYGKRCSGRVKHLPGVSGASRNPFIDMNIGLIEIQRNGDISKVKFKLVGYHPTEDRPITYFESNWLG